MSNAACTATLLLEEPLEGAHPASILLTPQCLQAHSPHLGVTCCFPDHFSPLGEVKSLQSAQLNPPHVSAQLWNVLRSSRDVNTSNLLCPEQGLSVAALVSGSWSNAAVGILTSRGKRTQHPLPLRHFKRSNLADIFYPLQTRSSCGMSALGGLQWWCWWSTPAAAQHLPQGAELVPAPLGAARHTCWGSQHHAASPGEVVPAVPLLHACCPVSWQAAVTGVDVSPYSRVSLQLLSVCRTYRSFCSELLPSRGCWLQPHLA